MESLLPIVLRWAHILAAVTAVGGVWFLRIILVPAATQALSDEEHARLRTSVMGRWKKVVMVCILLLLVSGVVNLILTMKGDRSPLPVLYHILFTVKFLAAMGVFFIASCLVGRSAKFEGMRKQAPKWLAITGLLGLLVILVSGVLKNL